MSKLTQRFPFLKEVVEIKVWQIWLGAFLLPIIGQISLDIFKWFIK